MKKYIYGIIAIVIAIGTFAFTKPAASKSKLGIYYFQFNSIVNAGSSLSNAYITATSINTSDPYSCFGTDYDCSIGIPGYHLQSPNLYVPSLTAGGPALSQSLYDADKSTIPTTKD